MKPEIKQNFLSVDKKTARSSYGEFFTIGEEVGHEGAEDNAVIQGFVEEFDGNEIKVFTSKGHCHLDFLVKLNDITPNYKEAYEEVMCYFDSISDEEKPKLLSRLQKLGL